MYNSDSLLKTAHFNLFLFYWNLMDLIKRLMFCPFNVQMVVTRRCNLDCSYCNEYDNTSKDVSYKLLYSNIRKLERLGAFSLTFTGGEPLLHPKLISIIRYAKNRLPIVTLITNGFLLTKEKISQMQDAGLDHIQLSIDGLHENGNTKKTMDNLKDKLELLKTAHLSVTINSVIGSVVPEEVEEIIRVSKEFGFKYTTGIMHDENGRMDMDEEKRRSYEFLGKLKNRRYLGFIDFEKKLIEKGSWDFKCRAGSRFLYVDEIGSVHWCSQTKDKFTKPLKEYAFHDLQDQFYEPKPCSSLCTIGCVRRSSFFDGFRRQSKRE